MDTQENKKTNIAAELFDLAQMLVTAFISVTVFFALIAGVLSVKGASMFPTLASGDMLVISDLFYTPKRGDIVMFNKAGVIASYDYENDRQPPLVKRIIAVGGDVVDYDSLSERFVINGEPIDEPYILERMLSNDTGTVYPLTVPEGQVFCMGDNRNDSLDSRYPEIGCIDRRYILGKALFRIVPLSRIGFIS